MDNNTKTSTDPQENEIDSNFLGKAFRALADDEGKDEQRKAEKEQRPEEDKTLDDKQDPAEDK